MNRRQTLLGWALVTAGFAAIAAAWGQVQGTHVVAVQLSYLTSGGLVGLGLIVLGTGLIRADDLRAIREGVDELRDRINDLEHDVSDTKGPQIAWEEAVHAVVSDELPSLSMANEGTPAATEDTPAETPPTGTPPPR